jgi:hypothetical protein
MPKKTKTAAQKRTTAKKKTKGIDTQPPKNRNEPIDWDKARESFRRLMRVHGEEVKRLSHAKTYREYE